MIDRPTPETDAARHDLSDYGSPVPCSWGDWVPFELAEKLERERDEAREENKKFREALEWIVERYENPMHTHQVAMDAYEMSCAARAALRMEEAK